MPSFNAMNNLSYILAKNNETYSFDHIHQKVGQYLVKHGGKEFVRFYNDVSNTKDYKQAIITLNL